ncbi:MULTISPECIES: hypothetical protein [Staphylococcus]|uniref:hypothetical protein n=1 Tax=Staphylococcus TaxID=1279 RepID=UPI000D1C7169|nr:MULTISPECIES: hypothetical protein [Staphylococcus]MDP4460409.1 hypothetical protein [Staphylococcus hyicus]PTF68574.1 hypothetical protein BUY03_09355 [Staphylococcus chromogenes]
MNEELNELFLKDMAYQLMIKQIEDDPTTSEMIKIYEKHGLTKQQAIAIMMDLGSDSELSGDQTNIEHVIKSFDSKLQRVYNRVEQVDKQVKMLNDNLNK